MIEYFTKGVNIGGWLAQYDLGKKGILTYEQRMEHFNSFITIKNIEQIAAWGADHIRVPINGELLLEENADEYFYYIDQCIQWCEDLEINIILDIHDIEG
jgi:aryl-phospho-beta-D-glucosidase BglC (GH1 family)